MAVQNLSAYQAKLYQFIFGLVTLALGFASVRKMAAAGSAKTGYMLAGIIVSLIIVLILDKRYWLVLPVLYVFPVRLPGIPFDERELACLAIIAMHGMRMALHRDQVSFSFGKILPILPAMAWIAMVFCLNPAGLHTAGTSSMGGRFYFKIFAAFLAFLSMSSLSLSENDAKLLFWTILAANVFAVARSVFPSFSPVNVISVEGFETQAISNYSFIGFGTLAMLLCARFPLGTIASSPKLLFLFLAMAAGAVYSGKRQTFGRLVLLFPLSCLLRRKDYAAMIVAGVVGAFCLVFLVAGDGSFYNLPRSAKRALAVAFPKYAAETSGGTSDLFRAQLRQQAYATIRERPWFGRKGFSMSLEQSALNYAIGSVGNDFTSGHAYSGNWHSMWLSFACDFGIPFLAMMVFLWLHVVRFCFRIGKEVVLGTYLPACCLVYSFDLLFQFIFGWFSGHASLSTQNLFVQYGILIALVNGYRKYVCRSPVPNWVKS